MAETTDRSTQDLRKSMRGGVTSILAELIKAVARFAALPILARLISPSEFGRFALWLIVANLGEILFSRGIDRILASRREITESDYDTIFWVILAASGIAALIILLGGLQLAPIFGFDASIFVAICLAVTINGALRTIPFTIMTRKLQLLEEQIIAPISIVASTAICIVLAVAEHSIWALVWRYIALSSISTMGFILVAKWFPQLRFDRDRWLIARSALLDHLKIALTSLFPFAVRDSDKLILSMVGSATEVGFLSKGTELVKHLQVLVIGSTFRPAFAGLVKARESPQFPQLFLRYNNALGYLCMPTFALLAANAEAVVRIIFGAGWEASTIVVAAWSVASIAMVNESSISVLLWARDDTRPLVKWSLISPPLILAALMIGSYWGMNGIAIAFMVAFWVIRYPQLRICLTTADITPKDFTLNLRYPILLASIVGASSLAPRMISKTEITSSTDAFLSIATAGTTSFIAATLATLLIPALRHEVCTNFRTMRSILNRSL